MPMCKCHPNSTFCPDMICIDMIDDVPIFARKDSPEGKEMIRRIEEGERRRDRETFDALKAKYNWQ